MKNSIKLLTLLTVFAFAFTSCSKDDDPDGSGGGGNTGNGNTFAVTIDGTVWSNTTTEAYVNASDRLIVECKNGDESVVLVMPGDITAGTYTMGAPNQNNFYNGTYKPSPLADPYGSVSGELKISTHTTADKKISGTFKFTAFSLDGQSQKLVTGGNFTVTYTVQ